MFWRALIFLAVVGVVVFFLATHFMNKFNAKKSRIKKNDNLLKQYLNERLSLIDQLNRTMPQDTSIGQSGVKAALRASKKATTAESTMELGMLMGEATTNIERVKMQLRNPNIANPNQAALSILEQIEEINRKIKIAKRERNDDVREYNELVTAGASAIVASMFKYEELDLLLGENDRGD